MESNNWRPIQGGEPGMDSIDWRTQLQPDSRLRIVNKIMDTLKKHLPFSGQEGLHELKKIAERFEEKIYSAATSQSDYLRKISLKMLTMETKSQNSMPNSLPANSQGTNNRPPDPGTGSQTRPQLLPQHMLISAGVQSSSTLSSALPHSSLSQPSISSAVGQYPSMPNMPGTSQGVPTMYASSQRQMQGRQQVVPQQQQQSQNSQQYMYQQQFLKPKFQQGNMPQSHIHLEPIDIDDDDLPQYHPDPIVIDDDDDEDDDVPQYHPRLLEPIYASDDEDEFEDFDMEDEDPEEIPWDSDVSEIDSD